VRHAPAALVTRYVRALFDVAVQTRVLEKIRTDLQGLSETWQGDPELALLLMNPALSRDKVRAILNAVADRLQAAQLTRHFLDLLLVKDRLDVLSDASARFEALWLRHEGRVVVTVTTAVPVSESLQTRIHDVLAEKSGKKPLITWMHKPDLLGGIVVEWPGKVFDGSLARKLENLKQSLAQGA